MSEQRMKVWFATLLVLGGLVLLCTVVHVHMQRKPSVLTLGYNRRLLVDVQYAVQPDLVRERQNQVKQLYDVEQRLQHGQSQKEETLNNLHLDPSKMEQKRGAQNSEKEDAAAISSKNERPTSAPGAQLPVCPVEPPKLVPRLLINVRTKVDIDNVVKENPQLQQGGFYSPPDCQPRDKVAIIIPFRDRYTHLHIFLHYMIPILCHQLLQFKIYIIEQTGNCPFNRGMLLNVGALEAAKDNNWQCYCFHDIDLIMEDGRNLYTCPESPKHLSVAVDKFDYKLLYRDLFGGITIFTKEQFWKINGYSNEYWGWGGEDDDAYKRVVSSGMTIMRPNIRYARYKMIRGHEHTHDRPNPSRFKLLEKAAFRMKADGLNNALYEVVDQQLHSLYTKIAVKLKGHVKC